MKAHTFPNSSSFLNSTLRSAFIASGLLFLHSCSTNPSSSGSSLGSPRSAFEEIAPAPVSPSSSPAARKSHNYSSIPEARPGLGTDWGNKVNSRMKYTNFSRSSNTPYGKVSSIYYNDKEGVEAMTTRFPQRKWGLQKAANGLVEWGVKQGWSYSENLYSNGKRFISGKKNRRYSIVIKNICHSKVEAVVSVDGLDVMSGQQASLKNHGYIIPPGETLEIKGFRTSEKAVAAFKFSSVDNSYTNERHGSTRNVGVIGLAIFSQKGRDPWKWSTREVKNRQTASPFVEAAR